MKKIFLTPFSSETSYEGRSSSMEGMRPQEFSSYITEDDAKKLDEERLYHAWGCKPSNKAKWSKMERGDYVMFYSNRRFTLVGTLVLKKFSKDLALSLWPKDSKSSRSDEPWSCVFFVEDIKKIDLALTDFNNITGYSMDRLQGFMPVVRDDAINNIIDGYGSIDGFIDYVTCGADKHEIDSVISLLSKNPDHTTNKDSSDLVNMINNMINNKPEQNDEEYIRRIQESMKQKRPEQIERVVKIFRRNITMVRKLKKKHGNKCQICGFTFKTSSGTHYSEAAHIVPISSAAKGVDSPENIWILCANHHKMLDYGALDSVDRDHYRQNGTVYQLLEI